MIDFFLCVVKYRMHLDVYCVPRGEVQRRVLVVGAREHLRAVFNEEFGGEREALDARVVERSAPVVVLVVQQLAQAHLRDTHTIL